MSETGFYSGCEVTLTYGSEAQPWIARAKREIAEALPGIEIHPIASETPGKFSGIAVRIPDGHIVNSGGLVDVAGHVIQHTGTDFLLHVVEDILAKIEMQARDREGTPQ